ncbi:MAG: riboflavin synthase [Myxococcota bacterium]
MFTGLVEATGRVLAQAPGPRGGVRLETEMPFSDLKLGDSIAHSGVCLTAVVVEEGRVQVDIGPETLARTTAGSWAPGRRLNLERSVLPTTRLGGHLVQGHVDGVARLSRADARDNAWDLEFELEAELLRLVIPRGSVAVDGISLTVTGRGASGFSVSIIPHTWKETSLSDLALGDPVNIEVDLVARYVDALFPGVGLPGAGEADLGPS